MTSGPSCYMKTRNCKSMSLPCKEFKKSMRRVLNFPSVGGTQYHSPGLVGLSMASNHLLVSRKVDKALCKL